MMTRRPEHPTHATGAHRAQRGAPRAARTDQETLVQRPPVPYEPYVDGLFTYCLSVLCEHDAAVAALGEVLALAERRADRSPDGAGTDTGLRRSWLYALARWACLRRLMAQGAKAGEAHAPAPVAAPRGRREELALLAWPEAAGTTAEQREALELAVRHGLSSQEVAAVLRLEPDAARGLLSSAACEVERTRTALAVVESGHCPVVSRFSGDAQVLLGAALRRELVRHVDDCADCRRTAERATAGEPWPGTAASSAALPVVEAPVAAVHAAMLDALAAYRQRGSAAPPTPRFDRRGFPQDPKDRAARRGRLRSRALTTTVVATVVAAPVLALWAAYRGAPETGESQEPASVSAEETGGTAQYPFDGTGPARKTVGSLPLAGPRAADLSVSVIGPDGRPVPAPPSGSASPPAGASAAPLPGGPPPPPVPGPGRLTLEAQPSGTTTLITLRASGGEPVVWSMTTDAPWLRLSRTGGVLRPGQSLTVVVTVDHTSEPAGRWSARVAVAPGGSTVTIEGRGSAPEPSPSPPRPSPPPPDPAPPAPGPSPVP
ncbi:BACON domain-containing protein [Streptomyces albireticuli]|uniref:BACON domain-containing protein n=1 Tax=Streptomyces albireticuli TaxID=1940 RepID=UPI0036C97701